MLDKQTIMDGSQCLKITQNVTFEFINFGNFQQSLSYSSWPVWYHCLTARFRFSKTRQNWPILAYLMNFCPLKMLTYNATFWVIFKHCKHFGISIHSTWKQNMSPNAFLDWNFPSYIAIVRFSCLNASFRFACNYAWFFMTCQ